MVVSYGKKPRKSKTSELVEVEELSFFLYNAKSTTKGLTEIYLATEPYPLIAISESNEKAKLWLNNSITMVKLKIASIGSYTFIPRDEYIKAKPTEEDDSNSDYPTVEELQEMHNKIMGEL